MKKIFLAFLLIFGLSRGLYGITSATLGGTIGLIEMPTAFTLEQNQFYLGADYSNITFWNPDEKASQRKDFWSHKLNLTTFRDLEFGVIGESGREGVFLNLKYYLINPVVSGPIALALGLENLTSYNRSAIYMVASKRFNQLVAGHMGFKSEFPASGVFVSAMLGLEVQFTKQFSVLADYRIGNELSRLNAGLRIFVFDCLVFNVSGIDLFGKIKGISAGGGLINYF